MFKRACGGVAAGPIREAQAWVGPPHPQLGNALNLRVRDAAKETLDEVFKLGAPPQPPAAAAPAAGGAPDLRGRIQGYGSTTGARIQSSYAGASGGGGGGGQGKYGGFGSEDVRRAEEAGGSWMSAAQRGDRVRNAVLFLQRRALIVCLRAWRTAVWSTRELFAALSRETRR